MEYWNKSITPPFSHAIPLCYNILSRVTKIISPKHQISKAIYHETTKICLSPVPRIAGLESQSIERKSRRFKGSLKGLRNTEPANAQTIGRGGGLEAKKHARLFHSPSGPHAHLERTDPCISVLIRVLPLRLLCASVRDRLCSSVWACPPSLRRVCG